MKNNILSDIVEWHFRALDQEICEKQDYHQWLYKWHWDTALIPHLIPEKIDSNKQLETTLEYTLSMSIV